MDDNTQKYIINHINDLNKNDREHVVKMIIFAGQGEYIQDSKAGCRILLDHIKPELIRNIYGYIYSKLNS